MGQCSTLGEQEHKLLRILTKAADSKGWARLEAATDHLQGKGRWDLETLEDLGYIERPKPLFAVVTVRCNCGSPTAQTIDQDTRRAIRHIRKQRLSGPSRTPSANEVTGPGPDGPPHLSLRSRESGQELSTTNYRDSRGSAGQRVSGRRVSTEVARKMARRNTIDGWQDKPVERWTARDLAGYFNAQSWDLCRGKSPDRFSLKPMLRHFAAMRREGVTSVDAKAMVDLYLGRLSAQPGTVDSVWKAFISQRGRLARQLTSNAGMDYTNQPKVSEDDDLGWT